MDDIRVINNIRMLGIDMITNAKSGHPGIVLGAAPIIYTLFKYHLRIDPLDPTWEERDRFIMSAGHGSALLYSVLHYAGFQIAEGELRQFRKYGSLLPGHPEFDMTPGVEMSTGPLGQGIASSVGFAIAEELDKENDYYTYVLAGDGDLMEGISYEAAAIAGHLKLGKLIVLYDSNDITLDGSTSKSFTENVRNRFSAQGWHTDLVENGENIEEINGAIEKAKTYEDMPSLIEIKTVIGKYSKLEGSNKVHGAPLSLEEIISIKESLGLLTNSFSIDYEAKEYLTNIIKNRIGHKKARRKQTNQNAFISMDLKEKEALRDSNARAMNEVAKVLPNFIGGSADLASSTKTYLDGAGDYPNGKNIWFGVREHAMGAILNGLALSGHTCFGSTFLVFADYLKPAIRLSCLMNLPVIYIFTHDSINSGTDGPTHLPVEQLVMLRSIPNLNVYRPSDTKEVIGVWNAILEDKKPAAIVLSRNEVPLIASSRSDLVDNGAYIIKKEKNNVDAILISSGSELSMVLEVAENLSKQGVDLRVVSMPSMSKFEQMSDSYKEAILPNNSNKIIIEASSKMGLREYASSSRHIISVDTFGISADTNDILRELKFDANSIQKKIEELI